MGYPHKHSLTRDTQLLEFVLNVFVKEKEHKTPAQWREETFEKFRPPSVLLKAYSGHKLNIISEVSLRLTHGSRTVEVVVLVQEGVPHELLLGTDVQSKLGFALVAEEETKLVDLLTGQEKDFAQRNPSSAGGASQSPQTPSSAVSLPRVPAQQKVPLTTRVTLAAPCRRAAKTSEWQPVEN